MRIILFLPLIIMTSVLLQASGDVKDLAEEKCGSCHLMGLLTKEKIDNMKAPPYWAMSKVVKLEYTNRADMINFIVDYTLNPREDKMLFPPVTKKRFGIMPSLKGKVTEDEIRQIAEYFLNK
ncbi:MAG: c-type cytochrome [Sulfurimonas sp.]|nr:c-type cytochrome [Sulfurimonas sp.]